MSADRNEALRLADSIKTRAIGWTEWRVESPVDGGYVMVFTQAESLWPEKEAREWLELHKQNHPNSMYSDYVVAKHHCYSRVEQDALDAAALLRQQAERIAELEKEALAKPFAPDWAGYRQGLEDGKREGQAERDQLRAEVERLRVDAERWHVANLTAETAWKHPDHRSQEENTAFSAYRCAVEDGLNFEGAVDAAVAAIDQARTTHKDPA